MTRQRRNTPGEGRTRRPRAETEAARRRARRRGVNATELDLSDEELRALADDRVDPEDVARLADEENKEQEASDHDRDTVRDKLEGLLLEQEEDY